MFHFENAKIEYEQNEHIVAQFRKHWFVFFMDILFLVPMLLLPFLVVFLTSVFGIVFPIQFNEALVIKYEIFFGMLWLLICWILFFISLTDYYLDVLRITNKRIIDIDQRGFFNRNVATMRVDNIEDVTVDTQGFFATILRYGTIRIQSAGERREFNIPYVTDPEYVKATISKIQDVIRERVQEVKVVS